MDQVSSRAGLSDVIRAILDSGLRTTAVVSDDGMLVGVVTEGDVLRAVGRGGGPGLLAEELLSLTPQFLVEPESDEDLILQFLESGHLAVPVVDAEGHFLKLESTSAAVQRLLSKQ